MSTAYRTDRSYQWNYSHAPSLPRVRRLPSGPGGRLFGYALNSQLGIAAGPLLNSRWVEGYARLGFDILTYKTVRTTFRAAHPMPNIRPVANQNEAAVVVARRPTVESSPTLAVSLGLPSMEPDVWRRDVRRARERIGRGQVLVVSVAGTAPPGGDAEALVADYARCAQWAAESGADIVEVHLATPDPFAEQPQMIFENLPLAAHVLYRVRSVVAVPVVAKVGVFRNARLLHETANKLAPWAAGFTAVHGVYRRVVDDQGRPAFEGEGREQAAIVGTDMFAVASRQVAELLAWRKAGAWDRAVLAVGGIATVERARGLLREGADAALVATAALFDPLLAARFRQALASAA
jgi:dihydroorotate dehydrogenase